jgi:hypothetical protein
MDTTGSSFQRWRMGRKRMIDRLEPTDIYKTIIMSNNKDEDNLAVDLSGESLVRLYRFRPLGWSQSSIITFRGDGTVEIRDMIPFKGNNVAEG